MWPLLSLAQSYPSPTFQNLTVLGTFTSSGNVGLGSLASQAANTVVANITASSASPTAVAMPTCNTSASALNYTPITGFTCNAAINAAALGGATFAAPGPIGSTTASTGRFTTLTATSTITPSSTSGIVGTTTNDNANAGSIGEYVTANATSISIPTATATNITSISLTAGDWDVTGEINFTNSAVSANAYIAWTSTTSATNPGSYLATAFTQSGNTWQNWTIPTPVARYSLSATTTIYLSGQCNFNTGTTTANGMIRARRVR
ncbi:pectate lyase superfamily protein [Burkholderia multivorans]|nr:pectate lyase superfamily protein [Burkholderia multivorans]